MQTSLKGIYFKLVMVMVFWGSAFVSGRMLTQHFHPVSVAFVRFWLGSLILIPLLLIKKRGAIRISLPQFGKMLLLGLTGVFTYNVFFLHGLKLVEAGRASIFISTNPAITALFAALFLKEKFSAQKVAGILLALIGALIVVSRGEFSQLVSGNFGVGEVYLMAAVLAWVTYTLLGKSFLKTISPLEATTWAALLGSLMLLPFALEHGLSEMLVEATWIDWLNLSNLGFLSTSVSFIWYYQGVVAIGAARTSSFINLIPIVGITCGVLFLGETVSTSLMIGGGLAILGVLLVNKAKRPIYTLRTSLFK